LIPEAGMAKKRSRHVNSTLKAVTAERAGRLYRLLQFLGGGPRSREALIKHLKLDVRGFYRDLELLRAAHIAVTLAVRRYTLEESVENAIGRLPFPDPRLTLGDALQLAKGRGQAHRKLKEQISEITG
jgi:predicted DNA-binding transcriptional regulator YafY